MEALYTDYSDNYSDNIQTKSELYRCFCEIKQTVKGTTSQCPLNAHNVHTHIKLNCGRHFYFNVILPIPFFSGFFFFPSSLGGRAAAGEADGAEAAGGGLGFELHSTTASPDGMGTSRTARGEEEGKGKGSLETFDGLLECTLSLCWI